VMAAPQHSSPQAYARHDACLSTFFISLRIFRHLN
jgi:hypothetical protein